MGTTRRVRRTGWAWDTFAQRIATPHLRTSRSAQLSTTTEKTKKLHFWRILETEAGRGGAKAGVRRRLAGEELDAAARADCAVGSG